MIRDSFRQYAMSKNWSPISYRLFMKVNVAWGVFDLVVFSAVFKRINSTQIEDEMVFYDEITDQLEQDLRAVPEIYESTGLLLRPLDEYFDWGYEGSNDDVIEIDDHFMNSEVGTEQLRDRIGSKI